MTSCQSCCDSSKCHIAPQCTQGNVYPTNTCHNIHIGSSVYPAIGTLISCSERILEQKKRALLAKEATEQEHVRRAEEERKQRETVRNQAKARRIVEAQRAQQRAELDLQQKTAYFKVCHSTCSDRIAYQIDTHPTCGHVDKI